LDIPELQCEEFKAFEAQLLETMASLPSGPVINLTLSQAAPDLARAIGAQTDAAALQQKEVAAGLALVQADVQSMKADIQSIEANVNSVTTTVQELLRFITGSGGVPCTAAAVASPEEEPNITVGHGLEQAAHEDAMEVTYRWPEDNGGAIMQHKLSQSVFNIASVVREFRQGWGTAPSINELDRRLGAKWRRGDNTMAQKYKRRRRVVHRVAALEEQGYDSVDALAKVEAERGHRSLEPYGESLPSCQDPKCPCRT
jgi:hypothetical protein